jgi:CRISPR-associated protein Cas2
MRRRYLVMYDISDDVRLRKVHNVVRSHGERFQYSVFLCDLSETELVKLRWALGDVIDHSYDAVAIVDLGRAEQVAAGTFQFMGVRPRLPPGTSTVV